MEEVIEMEGMVMMVMMIGKMKGIIIGPLGIFLNLRVKVNNLTHTTLLTSYGI